MKKNKRLRIKLFYTKILLKIYVLIRKILPNIAYILKRHIEKISLQNSKDIYNIISK